MYAAWPFRHIGVADTAILRSPVRDIFYIGRNGYACSEKRHSLGDLVRSPIKASGFADES